MNSAINKTLIKKLYWDRHIDPDHIIGLFKDEPENFSGELEDLYRRVLNSCDWYTILKIFSLKKLKKDVLNEQIINRLFPIDLQERYRYARNILFR